MKKKKVLPQHPNVYVHKNDFFQLKKIYKDDFVSPFRNCIDFSALVIGAVLSESSNNVSVFRN